MKDRRGKERELVEKALQGDKEAVEEFYKKYFPKINDFVFGEIRNPMDAQEVVQDVFISALDSLPLFSFRSSLSTWLHSIAKHEVADYYRKKKIKAILFSRLPILETLASQALGPEEELVEKEIKARIARVFSRLSEGYQKILRLKYIEGYSVAEIAKILKISFKATESRLARARLAFREIWATESFQLPISNGSIRKNKKENLLELSS